MYKLFHFFNNHQTTPPRFHSHSIFNRFYAVELVADDGPQTLDEALLEVCARFVHNVPKGENSGVRLMFQLQQAHWYYLDHLVDSFEGLPYFGLRDFSRMLMERSAVLRRMLPKHTEIYEAFKAYISRIPVYGAILLTSDLSRALVVRPMNASHWVWPKGKVNEGEAPVDCAARETLEETGFDSRALLNERDYTQANFGGKQVRMYFGVGVPDSFPFAPLSRKEIEEIALVPLSKLTTKPFGATRPFLKGLRRYISSHGGSFETEDYSEETSRDDAETFGADTAGWSVEHMFATNEKLLGKAFTYDGNPQTFGDPEADTPSKHYRETPVSPHDEDDGALGTGGWSVEQMFATNEKLLGKAFTYDGNPQTFGTPESHPSRTPLKTFSADEFFGAAASTTSSPPPPIKPTIKKKRKPVISPADDFRLNHKQIMKRVNAVISSALKKF